MKQIAKRMSWILFVLNIGLVVVGLWAVQKLGGWEATLFRLKHKGLSGIYENRKSLFKVLEGDSKDIIWLGDSHTEKGAWSEFFQSLNHKNRGISGDYTEGILKRLPVILGSKPKAIFLMVGTNDLLMNMPAKEVMTYYERVVTRIKMDSPSTKIILQSVLPINSEDWTLPKKNKEIVALNTLLQDFAKTQHLSYIDLHKLFVNENGELEKKYTHDGIHLNGNAYHIWKKTITPTVEQL